ncbi:hypothetical protein F895_01939 [Acinetobacter sp. CIP 64.2]|uniref:hypothetical protein n=1 Tax=unclassified Acinetobacter TaxID=196816 RepID=UPI00028805E9|nr:MULTISPECIES: hypothetical protein [unclassified Acinetobacter]ENX15393.1 hypothetical protein F895_01939 [Acinetobacter sp. CIP 64.2]
MSVFIRSLISLLIALCFISNSFAMAISMNEAAQPVEQVISNHAVISDCGVAMMSKHDHLESSDKMDTSHCQKSLCCLGATFEQRSSCIERSLQSIKAANSAYVHQLTLGIYQLPYRPPNHVLFL